MSSPYFTGPIARLIEQLTKLPGIGPKTAQRLVMHLLRRPTGEVEDLAQAIRDAKQRTRYCTICSNLSEDDICSVCADPVRDSKTICVVEEPADVVAMERTRQYRGLYHVLQGAISPLDGVGPEQIKVNELLERLKKGRVEEVILASNPTIEGEATALYIARMIAPMGIRVTRIARGIPEGGALDYVDELTLTRALEGRRDIKT